MDQVIGKGFYIAPVHLQELELKIPLI